MRVMNPTCWMCPSKDKRPRALSPRAADRQKETEKQQQRQFNDSTGSASFLPVSVCIIYWSWFFFFGRVGVERFNWYTVSGGFYGSWGDEHRVQLELVGCHCNANWIQPCAGGESLSQPQRVGGGRHCQSEPGTWRNLENTCFQSAEQVKEMKRQKGRGRQSTH